MLNETLSKLINNKARIYITATGGGSGIQNHLWSIPGISSILVGCEFPYSQDATTNFLGFTPEKYCSKETAIDLAMQSYYKAYQPGIKCVGIGLTASVSSNSVHRGDHRVFVCSFSDDSCQVYELILKKGISHPEFNRISDGQICDALGLVAIYNCFYNDFSNEILFNSYLEDMNSCVDFAFEAKNLIEHKAYHLNCFDLALERFLKRPYFSAEGKRFEALPENIKGIFPGAFNPPHEGHYKIAETYEKFGKKCVFAIEQKSPHKGNLSLVEMIRRAKLLQGHNIIFTSGCSLYVDKAAKFFGIHILMGADAFVRMFDDCWGVDNKTLVDKFVENETRFYVADRVAKDGIVEGIDCITRGKNFRAINYPVGIVALPLIMRCDISSSQIRNK